LWLLCLDNGMGLTRVENNARAVVSNKVNGRNAKAADVFVSLGRAMEAVLFSFFYVNVSFRVRKSS
jgi:hypothetical protein